MAATTHELRRPRPLPAALIAAAMLTLVAPVAIGEASAAHPPATWALALDVAVGVAGAVALPRLVCRPVAAAVAFIALSAVFPTALPLAATATLWVARTRPLRVGLATGAAGICAELVRWAWRPVAEPSVGWWFLIIVASYAAIVGWGAWRQARCALLASLDERARRDERTRIAREMHDVLAHRLSLLATYAGALEYRPDAPAEQMTEAARVIRAGAHQALEDLRDVIDVLRANPAPADADPSELHPQPTFTDVGALVDESRNAGVDVELCDGLGDAERARVPAATGRTVYRVVQEALTNARKHAPGGHVRVALSGEPGCGLEVEVVNALPATSRTGPTVPGSGTGLVGLAERVHVAGGSLDHGVTSGGYRVHVSLPWPR